MRFDSWDRLLPESRRLAESVAQFLRRWDPIGVHDSSLDPPWPPDEYDSYAPDVLRLLRSGCDAVAITARLSEIRTARLGCPPDDASDSALAHELLDWWRAQEGVELPVMVKEARAIPVEFGGEESSGWLPPTATKPRPTPLEREIVDVRIFQVPGGYVLEWCARVSPTNPRPRPPKVGDQWYQRLEDAEAAAQEGFGIEPDQWSFPNTTS